MSDDKNITWLASYPKSGNPWLRFIVTSLVNGGSIDNSVEADEVTPDLDLIDLETVDSASLSYIKTHQMFNQELPWLKQTKSAIYLIRNPADVVISTVNYAGVEKSQHSIAIDSWIRNGPPQGWLSRHYGTWYKNVYSWTQVELPFPVLYLFYEDLLEDTENQVLKIVDFLDLHCSQEVIKRTLQNTSFETMWGMEVLEIATAKEGFFKRHSEDLKETTRPFVRKGQRGEGAATMNDAQLNALSRELSLYDSLWQRFRER